MQLYKLSFVIIATRIIPPRHFQGVLFPAFSGETPENQRIQIHAILPMNLFFSFALVSRRPFPHHHPTHRKKQDDLELPEYMAPELGWLGVELAEALPEEFVLVRGVGTGQLVAV